MLAIFHYNGVLSDVVMIKSITISTSDHIPIQLEVFEADHSNVLIINPAIGVKRRMYHQFAAYMAGQGMTVVLYNYRGMEDRLDMLKSDSLVNAESWGSLDQSAVIDWIHSELQPNKLWLMGHSLGGQIPGFARNLNLVDGLILVAAQKGDKRLWSFSGYLKLYLLWHVLIPLMSKGPTFNASKLGLGSYPWPSAAAKQWASWGQQKDYLFNPRFQYDLRSWHKFDQPILSFGFTDDPMAPEASIDSLLNEYGKNLQQTKIEKRFIDPHILNIKAIGHFGFFKSTSQALWQDTISWISNH